MLTASHETAAPRITHPLRADGWHAISIGVHRYESEPALHLLVKLDSDRAFSTLVLSPSKKWGHRYVDELFWEVAAPTSSLPSAT